MTGNVGMLQGIGVQAQDSSDDGKQRRRVDALVGCPSRLRHDLGLQEAEQHAAQLGPDPLADRHLLKEQGGFGGRATIKVRPLRAGRSDGQDLWLPYLLRRSSVS